MSNMKNYKSSLFDKIKDNKYYLVVYFIQYIIYVFVKQKMDFYTLFPLKIPLIIFSGMLVDVISDMEIGGSHIKNAMKGMKSSFKWLILLVIAMSIAEVFKLVNINLGFLFSL